MIVGMVCEVGQHMMVKSLRSLCWFDERRGSRVYSFPHRRVVGFINPCTGWYYREGLVTRVVT